LRREQKRNKIKVKYLKLSGFSLRVIPMSSANLAFNISSSY
jgi:hypothetical protein